MTGNPATKLEFGDDGFTAIISDGKRVEIPWLQVREIVAFRIDPDGTDLMCLGFRISNERDYIDISEETGEYEELLRRMCDKFSEISRNWWQEIAESYGTTTIYGISQSEQSKTSPAEKYLAQAKKRKPMTRRTRKRIIPVAIAIIISAGVGTLLSRWIAGFSNIAAVAVWPMLLIVVVARVWPKPRLFFLLLGSYHLAELFWHFIFSQPGPCLLSQLLEGEFQYLLLLGVEILLGISVMLIPDKSAAGQRPK